MIIQLLSSKYNDVIYDSIKLIVFSIFGQKSRLDSSFLTRLDYKLVVLSLVLHNFMKSISKSISWRNRTISLDSIITIICKYFKITIYLLVKFTITISQIYDLFQNKIFLQYNLSNDCNINYTIEWLIC